MFSSFLMQVMFFIGLALTIIGLVIYFMRPADSEKPNSFSGANFSFNVSHPGLWVFGVGAVMLIISLLSGMDSDYSTTEIKNDPYPQNVITDAGEKTKDVQPVADVTYPVQDNDDKNEPITNSIFNGNFSGYANGENYILHLAAGNNEVSGNMQEGQSSFSLYGKISNDYLSGNLNIPGLGNIPFRAYYQGSNLILQLDEETMNGLKLLGAIATENVSVLFAENSIVFHQD